MSHQSDKYVTLCSANVVNFYKLNPSIDPEIANALLVDLLNGCLNNSKHMYCKGDHINLNPHPQLPISNDNNTLNIPFKDSLSVVYQGKISWKIY